MVLSYIPTPFLFDSLLAYGYTPVAATAILDTLVPVALSQDHLCDVVAGFLDVSDDMLYIYNTVEV
jgi:hypothetical protein